VRTRITLATLIVVIHRLIVVFSSVIERTMNHEV
jgi:hypothetical protein